MQDLLIIGGGFAGVWAAMSAAATRPDEMADEITIRLVSSSRDLCIRPRLYEGASDSMMVPLKPLFDEIGAELILDTVETLDADKVVTRAGGDLDFDRLVLAAGSLPRLPECEGALEYGFWVDDFSSTLKFDNHVKTLDALQSADRTIVVVGASFSGIEIVTNLRKRLGPDFQLVLVDLNVQPGAGLGEGLEVSVLEALEKADVKFRSQASVERVTETMVHFSEGETLPSRTVVFATGFKANPLAGMLNSDIDAAGRVIVDENLRVPDHPRIFAAGDLAAAKVDDAHLSLMSCQHAMPMGVAAGRNAILDILGQDTAPYSQPFYATCLDLGLCGAVFTTGWDRRIEKSGKEGADMKKQINTQWIYPPDPSIGRDKIFELIRNG